MLCPRPRPLNRRAAVLTLPGHHHAHPPAQRVRSPANFSHCAAAGSEHWNRLKNLRALCQRCHMLHDRPHHLVQRWITYRRRLAFGDLFLGPYPALIAALTSKRPGAQLRSA